MVFRVVLVAGLVLLGSSLNAPAAETDASMAVAQEAATTWLALTDGGKYAQSWDAAAAYFRGSITKAAWQQALQGVRSPLGRVLSRTLQSATIARSLPGAPDGEYVVLQFQTQFANKQAAVETVTPMKDADGTWRVAGYYIR